MNVIPFNSPTTAIISGPTGSGKSTFIFRILENVSVMFKDKVAKIFYFYKVWQSLFERIQNRNVTFIKGLPNEDIIEKISDSKHNLLILDDMQMSALNSSFIANLFSRESHHKNLSVFLVLQNFFHQGKYGRDISLNSYYLILFRNKRDKNIIKILGAQIGLGKELENVYLDATNEAYGYIMIDLTPTGDSAYMLRSHIFPDEYLIVYK